MLYIHYIIINLKCFNKLMFYLIVCFLLMNLNSCKSINEKNQKNYQKSYVLKNVNKVQKNVKLKFLVKEQNSIKFGENQEVYNSSAVVLLRFNVLKKGYLGLYVVDREKIFEIIKPELILPGFYDLKSKGKIQGINLSELKGKCLFIGILFNNENEFENIELKSIYKWVKLKTKKTFSIPYNNYDEFSIIIKPS